MSSSPRRLVALLTLALSVSVFVGCNTKQPTLLLYCGAGIRPPVAEIVDEFSRQHDVHVECNYAGSELLIASIQLTGQGDLFMPGDVFYVDQAKEEGLITASKTVCYFIPVILVQKGNPKNIRSLADLARDDVTLGLGDPKGCAIGHNCSKMFEKNGIPEEELHVPFRSLTVNELGTQIKLGQLDAVIVWDAVAAYFADSGDVVAIPAEQNVTSTVAVGQLSCSEHPELAGQLLDFITSDKGIEIFKRHHYTVTPPE